MKLFNNTLKLVAFSGLALGLAAAANADARNQDDRFEATFAFDRTAPAEAIYKSFERDARKACRDNLSNASMLVKQQHLVRACVNDLVDQAVEKTGMEALVAFQGAPVKREQVRQAAK